MALTVVPDPKSNSKERAIGGKTVICDGISTGAKFYDFEQERQKA
jgi:hypothetical protein